MTTQRLPLVLLLPPLISFLHIAPVPFLRIANKPTVCGEYWAYVFPLAAFANAWLCYAVAMGTKSAEFVGLFFMAFATLAFILVIVRDVYHAYMCAMGRANWGDPILLVDSSYHPSRHSMASPRVAMTTTDHTLPEDFTSSA